MVALMTPSSATGAITITPGGDAEIDFALLSDERDVDALVGGVRLAMRVLEHRSFEHVVERVVIDDAGTSVDALTDEASIRDWLRHRCADYVHASSSCAMGTVVDDRGSLIGYERLHVCDASVFPDIPDVNTHLPTTMLAERLMTRGRILP
jgi:choline dehydrogenase-like flavoprotein